MRRTLWIAVGAAGGIYAYRKGRELLDEARDKGILQAVQRASSDAAGVAAQAKSLASVAAPLVAIAAGAKADQPVPGAAAAKVIDSRRTQ